MGVCVHFEEGVDMVVVAVCIEADDDNVATTAAVVTATSVGRLVHACFCFLLLHPAGKDARFDRFVGEAVSSSILNLVLSCEGGCFKFLSFHVSRVARDKYFFVKKRSRGANSSRKKISTTFDTYY